MQIYYLDDELILLEIFEETFSTKKIVITTFHDPSDFVSAVKSKPPQLLFIDYRLPRTNGDKLAQELKISVPIALVTGDINLKTSFKFDAIFEKPFKIREIQDFINSYL